MKVLWLIKGLGPGGAEQLLVNQARAMSHEAIDVSVAYLVPWKNHLVTDLEAMDIPVRSLEASREFDPRWLWRLRRLVVEGDIEVIHIHSPYVAALSRIAVRTLPRRSRPAVVYTEHNRWPRHSPLTRLANRLTLHLDDATLAVSRDVSATMRPLRPTRVEVVIHGVDLEAVRAGARASGSVRDESDIPRDAVLVCTVANFRREKAYEVLIEAAARAMDTCADLYFVSVGQGPLEDEMRALASKRGLDGRFIFLGYRRDAAAVMAESDIFTLASRHEGLPVSMMEALALGLPVVATAVGGVPEMVTDQVEGLLVEPDRPDLLADAFTAVARDDELRARMASAAAATGEHYDIKTAQARLEEIYRDLASSRRR